MEDNQLRLLVMVEKSVAAFLKENKFLSKNGERSIYSIEDAIGRALQSYKNIDPQEYRLDNNEENKIKFKELEVEINMSIRHPDMYHIGNWKECWDKQKFLRDKKWLKVIEKKDDVLDD